MVIKFEFIGFMTNEVEGSQNPTNYLFNFIIEFMPIISYEEIPGARL